MRNETGLKSRFMAEARDLENERLHAQLVRYRKKYRKLYSLYQQTKEDLSYYQAKANMIEERNMKSPMGKYSSRHPENNSYSEMPRSLRPKHYIDIEQDEDEYIEYMKWKRKNTGKLKPIQHNTRSQMYDYQEEEEQYMIDTTPRKTLPPIQQPNKHGSLSGPLVSNGTRITQPPGGKSSLAFG
mmetsp:Transcript_2731/g.3924  ORF Transcript_2731/g.3924 Transcript_2731/m.3924 type:complete len:184 (+) Transcript_2731:43-594(+)